MNWEYIVSRTINKKLILIVVLLIVLTFPAWYGVNYYAAGLVKQEQLIEFGMEEEFLYCNKWRPELLDLNYKIKDQIGTSDDQWLEIVEYPLLHWALKFEDYQTAKQLLKYDLEIDATDSYYGNTALSIAAEKGQLDIVKILVERGAVINHYPK